MKGLLTHCGANAASIEKVNAVTTPAAVGRWHPIPHQELIGLAKGHLTNAGYEITEEAHALRNGGPLACSPEYDRTGAQYFGLLSLKKAPVAASGWSKAPRTGSADAKDYGLTVGLRNANDQGFRASLALGTNVFVCDNMCFHGEVVIGRKHTKHILDDLPNLMAEAVDKLVDFRGLQDERFDAYKSTRIDNKGVHDLVIRALDAGAISASKIPTLLHEWREPALDEWKDEPQTAWRLHNTFTEVWKHGGRVGPVWNLGRRSKALHGVLDQHCRIDLPTLFGSGN